MFTLQHERDQPPGGEDFPLHIGERGRVPDKATHKIMHRNAAIISCDPDTASFLYPLSIALHEQKTVVYTVPVKRT